MERFMRENLAGKWFCAFALSERTPDHSFFGDFRQRPGTKRLMDLFSRLRDGLKESGLIREGIAKLLAAACEALEKAGLCRHFGGVIGPEAECIAAGVAV